MNGSGDTRRYGGPHSPGTGNGFRGRAAARVDLRGLILFVLPVPLFFGALGHIGTGNGIAALGTLAAFAMLMTGAWLNREGQRAEAAFEARKLARPPALPRKLAAAALAGLGVATACLTGWGLGFVSSVLMGAIAGGAHVLAFGIDPLRAKGLGHGPDAERAMGALEQAEARIAQIKALVAGLRDRQIERKVNEMLTSLRGILGRLESDPRDLDRARRYLSVYLAGAEDATRKYAGSQARLDDPSLREDYLDLLDQLDTSFQRGQQAMLQDDRDELEIEIEVLRERLAAEH